MSNIGQLPPGWENPMLSETARLNPGLDRCVMDDSVKVTFVPMRAIQEEGGGLIRPEERFYREVKKGYKPFLSGDVIMAKITPCMENGKIAVVPELPGRVGFGSTEFHVIRPEQGVESRWIANYLLQHEVRRTAQRQMTGGVGQMRVPASFLETIRLPLPPSAEQSRIADALDEIFSDLDAGVASLERVRDKLKRYRASVLKEAVEGALTADWRAQHPYIEPASELLKRILDERRRRGEEQLAMFCASDQEPTKRRTGTGGHALAPGTVKEQVLPDKWCWTCLDQVFRVDRGRFSVRPRNDPRYYGGEIPFVQIGDLPREGGEIRSYAQTLNAEGAAVSRKFPVGTILIAIVGATIGNTGILTFDSCCPDSLVALQSNSTVLLKFAEIYLRTKKLSLRVAASASGGQPNINLQLLQPLPLPLPPLDEATAIIEAVEDQLSVIQHLEADLDTKLRSAQALRQAILRRAFTGQLVQQDPNDEPASELLQRIATERETRVLETTAAKLGKSANGARSGRGRRSKNKTRGTG